MTKSVSGVPCGAGRPCTPDSAPSPSPPSSPAAPGRTARRYGPPPASSASRRPPPAPSAPTPPGSPPPPRPAPPPPAVKPKIHARAGFEVDHQEDWDLPPVFTTVPTKDKILFLTIDDGAEK